jgi:hypothetical protein
MSCHSDSFELFIHVGHLYSSLPEDKWADVRLKVSGCDGFVLPDNYGWIRENFNYQCISSAIQDNETGQLHLKMDVTGPDDLIKVLCKGIGKHIYFQKFSAVGGQLRPNKFSKYEQSKSLKK